MKKDGSLLFDVTMGNIFGAEVCELIGLYLLNKIKALLGTSNVELYRDSGLAILHNPNDPKLDRLRKDMISLLRDEGLSITVDMNLIETGFSDVSFNLNTGKYFSFKRQNNTSLYIHSKTNHSPSIIKQSLSADAFQTFPVTKLSLTKLRLRTKRHLKTGYQETLKFKKIPHNTRRNRNSKVIWFNRPFSLNVKTNIDKEFFKLIRKHFSRNHSFSKIFNLNTTQGF